MKGLHLLIFLVPCLSHAQDYAPPHYELSLDLPPEQRWEPVLKHYNYTEIKQALDFVFVTSLPKWVHAIVRLLSEIKLAFQIHEPYAGEIRGIARTLGVNVGDVVAFNLYYETAAYCTSIIAQDDKGNVYHGRNMDYFFPDILKKLTLDLDFIQNGKVAYTGTTFIGYVGLWTGQRPYEYTISGNARDPSAWWKNVISAFFVNRSPVSWLIRDALNNDKDFEAAAQRLSTTPIMAETYYIIGGAQPKEGLVITRDKDGPANCWPLDPLRKEWFLVETNFDHWTTPPPYDAKRTLAIKVLNATGQANINTDSLYKVLSVKPVMNPTTVYTTVMSAATPEKYTTRIRNEVLIKEVP